MKSFILLLSLLIVCGCGKDDGETAGEEVSTAFLVDTCGLDPRLLGTWDNTQEDVTVNISEKCIYTDTYCPNSRAMVTSAGASPDDPTIKYIYIDVLQAFDIGCHPAGTRITCGYFFETDNLFHYDCGNGLSSYYKL